MTCLWEQVAVEKEGDERVEQALITDEVPVGEVGRVGLAGIANVEI